MRLHAVLVPPSKVLEGGLAAIIRHEEQIHNERAKQQNGAHRAPDDGNEECILVILVEEGRREVHAEEACEMGAPTLWLETQADPWW